MGCQFAIQEHESFLCYESAIYFFLLLLGVDMEPKHVMDISLIPSIDPIDIGLGSSEKGNAMPSAKPRKKTMTSVYLKFFETAPDGKSRRCKFCGQSYSIATATGTVMHLPQISIISSCTVIKICILGY